ncbi:MAG: hypothetical protein ACKO40_12845 [Planctomycetaceae bacterium]
MFVERSAGRIRRARGVFFLLAVLPFVVLVAWAVQRGSAAHRDEIRDRWQRAVGMGLTIEAVEHPRPGVTRARRVSVVSPTGGRIATFPVVEVEAAADEDRLRFEGVQLDAATAEALGDLGREWLQRDARHPRSCVIDVASVAWSGEDAAATSGPRGLRIECVARGTARAVRVTRPGTAEDLLRVVRSVVAGADGVDREGYEVEVAIDELVPLAVVAGFAGLGGDVTAMIGDSAAVAGRCSAAIDELGWHGESSGRVLGIDLTRCVAPLGAHGGGTALAEIDRLAWRAGRVVDARAQVHVGAGWIDAAFTDRLTLALGCRPAQAPPQDGERRFDSAGFDARIEGGRVVVTAPNGAGALAIADGVAVINEPAAAVPFERLAWVLSPPSSDFVPAGGAGAWLMTIQPRGDGREAARPPDHAERGAGRGF